MFLYAIPLTDPSSYPGVSFSYSFPGCQCWLYMCPTWDRAGSSFWNSRSSAVVNDGRTLGHVFRISGVVWFTGSDTSCTGIGPVGDVIELVTSIDRTLTSSPDMSFSGISGRLLSASAHLFVAPGAILDLDVIRG